MAFQIGSQLAWRLRVFALAEHSKGTQEVLIAARDECVRPTIGFPPELMAAGVGAGASDNDTAA
jgi:hypothetical protein